jgi:hypothetical protein
MRKRINVSRGQRINFAADGHPVSGMIAGSEKATALWALVEVETETPIAQNAQLTIPDIPETGGCGLAHLSVKDGRTVIELSIGYSYVDVSTIGK